MYYIIVIYMISCQLFAENSSRDKCSQENYSNTTIIIVRSQNAHVWNNIANIEINIYTIHLKS